MYVCIPKQIRFGGGYYDDDKSTVTITGITAFSGNTATGKGGAICEKARQWLKAQERNGKVKTVIFGEDFTLFNFKALELKNKYQELEQLMRVCNNGVTVVEL